MHAMLARLFERRGYEADFLKKIETCDHDLPSHLGDLCDRLLFYRRTGGRIVLLTDFDTDGLMSGVLGFAGLVELGFCVSLYLPETSSYGFGESDVRAITRAYPDVKAILTADVGVSAHEGVAFARSLGIEVLVTDHHLAAVPSDADVVVDPACDSNPRVYSGICGAHVLYLVLEYYARHYVDPAQTAFFVSQIHRLRVFAGIATVSDGMPVSYENRPLIRDAVSICRLLYSCDNLVRQFSGSDAYLNAFSGLQTMLRGFERAGKISDAQSINEIFFGFYVAPAFNSIKRMNSNVSYVYTLFFHRDSAPDMMRHILDLTEERKALVQRFWQALSSSDHEFAPFLFLTDAPGGLRGLLAQKMMSDTLLPAIVVARHEDGSFSGSGRSPEWYPFFDIVKELPFVTIGGHNAAFGISLPDEQALRKLFAFLQTSVEEQRPSVVVPAAAYDLSVSLRAGASADFLFEPDLILDFLDDLELCRPFGSGFPYPNIRFDFPAQDAEWSFIGADHRHVRAVFPGGFSVLFFNQSDLFPSDLSMTSSVVFADGHFALNEFRGQCTLQFIGRLLPDLSSESGGAA